MRALKTTFILSLFLLSVPAFAASDGKSESVKPVTTDNPLEEIWSGYHYASHEAKKLQDSDADNPAMALVKSGEELWTREQGSEKRSCATCHREADRTLKGTAARYPAWFKPSNKPLTISGRINLCREKFMGAKPLPDESDDLMALTIYVKHQSRGMAMSVPADDELEERIAKGRKYYSARRGQLDISCANCHDKYAGRQFRAFKLSQGHANGFPAYRKSWKKTGTLLRQVNQCLGRLRANSLKAESEEMINLRLYLAWRGTGLEVETPAVRD